MAQSVDKLKELLFDNEARALVDLTERVDGIERAAHGEKLERENICLRIDGEKRLREEIGARIDGVFDRAGTTDRFEISVADVLDKALRRAEVDRHTELASAIAPLVVRTVKTEIRNSRDELVEVLYPMTGRMVQAYVASAMKDLNRDINRKLEQNPVMLRLRSLASGKSVAEMAIAESQRLVIEELYLIRRGSGELVGRWPEASDGVSGRDHVMSGVLTAINEFSTEALKDDGSALRQIDLGERQLFLRVSPSYLLAAKCSGSAPQAIETELDQAFLEAMEELQNKTDNGDRLTTQQSSGVLAALSKNLEQRLDDKTGELANQAAGASPLKILGWLIGLPLAAWLIWSLFADYRTERAHAIASRTLGSFSGLNGYPVSFDVSRLGRQVTISGLAPAQDLKDGLLQRLHDALPASEIVDRLSVLPNDLASVEPRIAGVKRDVSSLAPEVARVSRDFSALAPKVAQTRDDVAAVEPKIESVRGRVASLEQDIKAAVVTRALDRAQLRLREAQGVVGTLAETPGPPLNLDQARGAQKSVDSALKALDELRAAVRQNADASPATLKPSIELTLSRIRDSEAKVSALAGLPAATVPSAVRTGDAASSADATEMLAAEADRLGSVALASAQIIAVKRSLPPPPAPVVIPQPTARDKLVTFARANAVFFTNDVDFRTPAQANGALDQLSELMRGNDILIRVVGYTDDQGPPDRNTALSEARSGAVVDALKARGISPSRLIKIGRVDAIGISPERGASSPNRRVEFEVGFVGEGGP